MSSNKFILLGIGWASLYFLVGLGGTVVWLVAALLSVAGVETLSPVQQSMIYWTGFTFPLVMLFGHWMGIDK